MSAFCSPTEAAARRAMTSLGCPSLWLRDSRSDSNLLVRWEGNSRVGRTLQRTQPEGHGNKNALRPHLGVLMAGRRPHEFVSDDLVSYSFQQHATWRFTASFPT